MLLLEHIENGSQRRYFSPISPIKLLIYFTLEISWIFLQILTIFGLINVNTIVSVVVKD